MNQCLAESCKLEHYWQISQAAAL